MTHGCRQLEETFLHAFVDGEFSPEEDAEVKVHLAGCAACTHAVRLHRSYKAAMLRANAVAPHPLYEGVRERLHEEPTQGRWARAFQKPSTSSLSTVNSRSDAARSNNSRSRTIVMGRPKCSLAWMRA